MQETPFPELAGIQVCRNCGRNMKQIIAFCRNHGVDLISVPQVGLNSADADAEEAKRFEEFPAKRKSEEEPPSPPEKKPAKAR